MSDFHYAVEIRVSPALVWSVLLDVERWPEWTTSVSRIQRMEIGAITIGSRTRVWQPHLRPAVWRVTSLDEKRRVFGWTTRTLGTDIVGRHQIDPLKNYSRVTLTIDYTGSLSAFITRLYGKLTLDYIIREGDGLKRFCESMPVTRTVLPPQQIRPTAQTS